MNFAIISRNSNICNLLAGVSQRDIPVQPRGFAIRIPSERSSPATESTSLLLPGDEGTLSYFLRRRCNLLRVDRRAIVDREASRGSRSPPMSKNAGISRSLRSLTCSRSCFAVVRRIAEVRDGKVVRYSVSVGEREREKKRPNLCLNAPL